MIIIRVDETIDRLSQAFHNFGFEETLATELPKRSKENVKRKAGLLLIPRPSVAVCKKHAAFFDGNVGRTAQSDSLIVKRNEQAARPCQSSLSEDRIRNKNGGVG